MEMVGHEHVGMHRDAVLARLAGQQRQHVLVVLRIAEDGLAVVAPLQRVVHETRNGETGKAGHGAIVA